MARILPKVMYALAVTRGRRTRYFYGTKLKDAIDAAGLLVGESFVYTKFVAGREAEAIWRGSNVYSVSR